MSSHKFIGLVGDRLDGSREMVETREEGWLD